jgi:hypothetical protein
MTASIRPEVVLSRTAEALDQQLAQWTAAELARRIGASRTSISRDWQGDLDAWPAGKLLRFASLDAHLRAEMVAALTGAPAIVPDASPLAAVRSLARRFVGEVDRLLQRCDDDNLSPIERAATERELDEIGNQVTQCRAALRAHGRRPR